VGYQQWIGQTLHDVDGAEVGEITDVYLDDATGRPELLRVATGRITGGERFVPVGGARPHPQGLMVDWPAEFIRDTPGVEVAHDHLEAADKDRIYRHYGLGDTEEDPYTGQPAATDRAPSEVPHPEGGARADAGWERGAPRLRETSTGEDTLAREETETFRRFF
jgi:hypothetical protein